MKFPFYKQLDGMDCGPSCLRMIARYHGKKFSVQQLREQSFIQRTGVNMQGISEAATSIGMRATGIRTTIDKLKQQSRLPCILHWNQIHFVVLYKIVQKKGKTYFYIADPAYGLLKYEEEELKKCWISTSQGGIEKGIAMLLEVTPQFYDTTPIKYEGISLWHLLRYVHPYRKMIVQLIIGLLAGSVLQLAFPFLTQTIVDQGIGHRNLTALPEGDITYGNIYEITPFENTLCIVTMNGVLLRELFENIAAVHGEGLSGACLEISGDGKLLDATVAGKEIEDSKEYKVATLDYLAEGNDHMTAFAKVGDADKLLPEKATVRQLFLNYVNEQTKAGKKIDSKIEGRITVKE